MTVISPVRHPPSSTKYEGRLPLYHFDVYRIGDADEMSDTGYYEYISGDGGDRHRMGGHHKRTYSPPERIEVYMEKNEHESPDSRTIRIRFIGDRAAGYERRGLPVRALAVDTSTATAGIAVADENGLLAEFLLKDKNPLTEADPYDEGSAGQPEA